MAHTTKQESSIGIFPPYGEKAAAQCIESCALMTHVARRVPDQVGREGSVAVTGMVVGTEDVTSHA